MKILTHTQLTDLLAKRRGAVILSIVSHTAPKFRKTDCPYNSIEKLEYKRIVVGAKYGRAVNKQIKEVTGADVEFKVSPRKWGEYVVEDKVVTHKGNLYLHTQARNPRPAIKTVWLADGKEVSKEVIKKYLVSSDSAKQAEYGLEGKRQVMVRDFTMGNVLKVVINGEEYTLIPSPAAQVRQLIGTLGSIKETIKEKRQMRRRTARVRSPKIDDGDFVDREWEGQGWDAHKC